MTLPPALLRFTVIEVENGADGRTFDPCKMQCGLLERAVMLSEELTGSTEMSGEP